jgi:hypothetical protein
LRGAQRIIAFICCKQLLLLLIHDLYLPLYSNLSKEGVSRHSDARGRATAMMHELA